MADLLELVNKPNSQFSSDMAEWLSPPKRPGRPTSRRHRTGLRNSIAFGVFWVVLSAVVSYAFNGTPPNIYYVSAGLAIAVYVGVTHFRSERSLATGEDKLLLDAHWERHRAYLQRRRVWIRLRYCSKCALAFDPLTRDTSSIFDVHELANSKAKEKIID